jgi:hypothetical protein
LGYQPTNVSNATNTTEDSYSCVSFEYGGQYDFTLTSNSNTTDLNATNLTLNLTAAEQSLLQFNGTNATNATNLNLTGINGIPILQEFFWCSLHSYSLAANATETTRTVDENGTVGTLQQRNLNLSCNLNLSHRSMVHNYQLFSFSPQSLRRRLR